jgi:hypothetical protein
MKDSPGCLRKGREKNFRSPVVSFMSTLPLVFWKISIGESNRFAHQEMVKAKAKGKTEKTFVEKSGSTILRWGNSWCSLVSSFKCAYSHYLDIHMCCIRHTALSCFLLSTFSTNQKCTPLQRQRNDAHQRRCLAQSTPACEHCQSDTSYFHQSWLGIGIG